MVGTRTTMVGVRAREIQSRHRETSKEKWVIFGKRLTPKIRKLKYENFTLYESAISNDIYLGKEWKLRLAGSLHGIKTTTSRLRRSLKSGIGNPAVVLNNHVAQSRSQEIG